MENKAQTEHREPLLLTSTQRELTGHAIFTEGVIPEQYWCETREQWYDWHYDVVQRDCCEPGITLTQYLHNFIYQPRWQWLNVQIAPERLLGWVELTPVDKNLAQIVEAPWAVVFVDTGTPGVPNRKNLEIGCMIFKCGYPAETGTMHLVHYKAQWYRMCV